MGRTKPLSLVEWMTRHQYSQMTAAAKLGITQATLSRWLNGKVNPTRRSWARLQRITGLPLVSIIHMPQPAPPAAGPRKRGRPPKARADDTEATT